MQSLSTIPIPRHVSMEMCEELAAHLKEQRLHFCLNRLKEHAKITEFVRRLTDPFLLEAIVVMMGFIEECTNQCVLMVDIRSFLDWYVKHSCAVAKRLTTILSHCASRGSNDTAEGTADNTITAAAVAAAASTTPTTPYAPKHDSTANQMYLMFERGQLWKHVVGAMDAMMSKHQTSVCTAHETDDGQKMSIGGCMMVDERLTKHMRHLVAVTPLHQIYHKLKGRKRTAIDMAKRFTEEIIPQSKAILEIHELLPRHRLPTLLLSRKTYRAQSPATRRRLDFDQVDQDMEH